MYAYLVPSVIVKINRRMSAPTSLHAVTRSVTCNPHETPENATVYGAGITICVFRYPSVLLRVHLSSQEYDLYVGVGNCVFACNHITPCATMSFCLSPSLHACCAAVQDPSSLKEQRPCARPMTARLIIEFSTCKIRSKHYTQLLIITLVVVAQVRGRIAGSPPPSPLRPPTYDSCLGRRFYRGKTSSALSSLVDPRRMAPTHGTRSQQLIPFVFLQITSKHEISPRQWDSNSQNQR